MAIGPVNNPYLQQILFQNLSSSTIQPNQLKDSTQLLNAAMNAKNSTANISAAGSKINKVSQTIRSSGGMQAFEGFQTAMQRAGTAADPMQMTRLVNSASYAANNDGAALNNSFAGLARTMGQNDNAFVDSFNKAFTSTVEQTGMSGLKSFNQGFASVEKADYSNSSVSLTDNLKQYFATANQAVTSGRSEEDSLSNMQRLAKGIEISEKADDIYKFFNEFTGAEPTKGFA